MRKHGRLLSFALATALTVTNMGALMPMTVFAAGHGGEATETMEDGDSVVFAIGDLGEGYAEGYSSAAMVIEHVTDPVPAATTVIKNYNHPGYTFTWNNGTDDVAPGVAYSTVKAAKQDGEPATYLATLTAMEVANDITLTLSAGSGDLATTGLQSPATVKYDTPASYNEKAIVAPTRDGYKFGGWTGYLATGSDASPTTAEIAATHTNVAEQAADIDTIYAAQSYTGDIKLDAIWTADDIVISYDLNGGTAATTGFTGVSKKYGEPIASAIVAPTNEGYTFAGWDLDGNGKIDGTDIASNEDSASDQSSKIDARYLEEQKKETPSDTVALTAVWTGKTFNLTSNLNDTNKGNGNQTASIPATETTIDVPSTKVYGTPLEKPIADPVMKYYSFKGWSIDGEDESIEIAPGATKETQSEKIDEVYLDENSDLEFKAIWEAKVYTLSFDADSFDGGSLPNTVKYADVEVTAKNIKAFGSDMVPAVAVTRNGYTESGWNLEGSEDPRNNFTTAKYIYQIFDAAGATDEIKNAESTCKATLKVNWVEDEFKVVLNNDVATNMYVSTANKDNVWVATTPGQVYTATLGLTGSIVLPTVVGYSSTGSHGINSKQNNVSFEVTDKEFVGWAGSSSATIDDVIYFAGDVVEYSNHATVDLYPVFVSTATFTVTFDGGRAADPAVGDAPSVVGEMDSITDIADGEEITLPANEFTAEHQHFTGWNNGQIEDEAQVTVTENTRTYEATWEEDTYNVIYYNGTKKVNQTNNVPFSKPSTTPSVTSEGKKLIGWDENQNSTDPMIPITGTGTTTTTYTGAAFDAANGETITLYAIFVDTESAITVTFNPSDNEGSPVIANGSKNAAITILTEAKSGLRLVNHELAGWTKEDPNNPGHGYASVEAAGDATIYAPGASEKFNENTDLYALWAPITYAVAFDANGGTGSMADMSVTYDGAYKLGKLNANEFARAGYSFGGWALTANDAKTYNDEEVVNNLDVREVENKVVTLYAVWTAFEYRISYDKNCATASGSKQDIVGTSTDLGNILLGDAKFDNSDETLEFTGWSLDSEATKPQFAADDFASDVINAANAEDGATIILYAVWEKTDLAKAEDEAEAQKEAAVNANKELDKANQKLTDAEKKIEDANKAAEAAPKTLNNAAADSGEKVSTSADGTAKLTTIPKDAVPANGSYTVPETVKVNGVEYKVTKIDNNAFKGNKKLKKVVVPAGIEDIGKNAFKGDKNLKKIYIKGKDVTIRKNAFKNINKKAKIFVRDKDTKTNVEAKGGAPKDVKIKVKK